MHSAQIFAIIGDRLVLAWLPRVGLVLGPLDPLRPNLLYVCRAGPKFFSGTPSLGRSPLMIAVPPRN